jgi:hypothetical protein
LSPLHAVQTYSGAHPASYPMGMGGSLSSGVKRPGREADHSQLVSRSRKRGSVHPFPIRLHGMKGKGEVIPVTGREGP